MQQESSDILIESKTSAAPSVTAASVSAPTPCTSLITYPKQPIRNDMLRQKDMKVHLITNLLKLEMCSSDQKLYNYSVTISPEIATDNFSLQSKIHRCIDHDLSKYFTRKSFSGNNLLGSSPNPQKQIVCETIVENVNYTVTLNSVGSFDLSQITDFEGQNQRYKSTLEKIIKDIMLKNKNTIKFGDDRTIVKVQEHNVIIPDNQNSNKESIYKGYYTSAQITECGLFLLVLNVNKHVSEVTVLDAITQIRNEHRSLPESEIRKLIEEYFITHRTVLTVYGSLRTYRIQSIDFDKSPSKTTFNIKDGDKEKTITVENYFKSQYRVTIKNRDQPLLIAEKKRKGPKKLPSGNETASNPEESPIYLVPELLYTTGVNGLSDNKDQRRNIISKTKVGPDKKLEEISKIYEMINNSADPKSYKGKDGNIYKSKTSQEVAREWGINLGENLQIEGRILPQPTLCYQGTVVKPNNGLFRSGNTIQGILIDKNNFVYIYDKKDNSNIRGALKGLFDKARMKGLNLRFNRDFNGEDVHGIALENFSSWDDIKNNLSRLADHAQQIKIAVVFLSPHLERFYSNLKEYFTNTLKVGSQFVVSKKLQDQRRAGSILFNIVEQMNVKMGGTNFYIDFYRENILTRGKIYLVIGLEMRQISANELDIVMTSTINPNLNKTITVPRKCRNNKEEKEKCMQDLLGEAIKGLKEGGAPRPPDFIIMYRQGGNYVQNKKMADNEVPVFKKYLEQLKQKSPSFMSANPKFIYVCCNLKGDLKFFELGGKQGNHSNPKSGLCVDSSVTQKDKYEFFIQPQFVNQGTATPCHYQVLYQDIDSDHPDNNLKMEQLQMLSFYLSFYYWTWAGAVRVPGALKLATTAADFFSKHLNNQLTLPGNRFQNPYYL